LLYIWLQIVLIGKLTTTQLIIFIDMDYGKLHPERQLNQF